VCVWSVGNSRCGDVTDVVAVKEEYPTCVSSELHSPESSAVMTTVGTPAEPSNVENLDSLMSDVDNIKSDNHPTVTDSSIPADSGVGTELTSGNTIPQSADSGSVLDTSLNEDVLQESLTQTLHRLIIPHVIVAECLPE